MGHGILLEMELAALPGDAGKSGGQGGAQSGMVITDDELQVQGIGVVFKHKTFGLTALSVIPALNS
jgi:hypothetical protein